MKLETYGKQKIFRQLIQDIKDKFRVSKAQKIMCSKFGFEAYRTPVSVKRILIALPVTIIAILIPCPPVTVAGLIYFTKVGLK